MESKDKITRPEAPGPAPQTYVLGGVEAPPNAVALLC